MKKILVHLCHENEYRSLVRGLVKNLSNKYQILGNNLHETLFDTHYKFKPDITILPTNEYTQEFHDYIAEYNRSTKIILFTNNLVINTNIINFWNSTGTTIVSKTEWYPDTNPDKYIKYDALYDDNIYTNLNKNRNTKIAVYLSNDDEKNHSILDKILYPNTKLELVLFNSPTFKNVQNIGLLTPEDSCRILNTYKSLIDIDNRFYLEASVCCINNLSINGNIIDNINNNEIKTPVINANEKSYSNFILTSLSPIL